MHTGKYGKFWFLAAVAVLLCVSCMERTEEITVAEDGVTTIVATFHGKVGDFRPPLAVATAPQWTILEHTVDTISDGDIDITLKAQQIIPYGQPLPETFAASPNDVNLRFPTRVKTWTDGNRTFYEFSRNYVTRDYTCYNLSETKLWDQDLEDRVLVKGIFNVSENDRREYLDSFVGAFGYLHWRQVSEALGQLVHRGELSAAAKAELDQWVWHYIESTVTPMRALGIMGKQEDSISIALDNLTNELLTNIDRTFVAIVGAEDTVLHERYHDAYRQVAAEYAVSDALSTQDITVTVILPGTIVSTNGLYTIDEPNTIKWYFEGADLHDCDRPLYALSVVEH